MFRSSRPTASRFKRRLTLTVGVCIALLGLLAPTAFAKKSSALALAETPVVCEGQVFSQPFLSYNDSNLYTLAPGGEFNSASEGWTLSGGASIVNATRPSGAAGGTLNLPSGAKAVSPPMCVTLAYPTARAWVSGESGTKGVTVSVSYAGTASAIAPQEVATIKAKHGNWTLGKFGVEPSLGGTEDAPREVRFVFEGGKKGATQLFDVYVDPRMR
jgi:hypothetical protein